ncbi:MAG TPA: hypothetical protein VGC84_05005 [Ilumatobacteraceae bacterium]|jgi:hypothetical protein
MSYRDLPWYAVPHTVGGWRRRVIKGVLPLIFAGIGLSVGYMFIRSPLPNDDSAHPAPTWLVVAAIGLVVIGVLTFLVAWFGSPEKIDDPDEEPIPAEWVFPRRASIVAVIAAFNSGLIVSALASSGAPYRWSPLFAGAALLVATVVILRTMRRTGPQRWGPW